MFRADLDAARQAWIKDAKTEAEQTNRAESRVLAYTDEAGRVADFHALRHTFITNLARGGVHPKLAQDLARHSDFNVTMSRYTHTVLTDRAKALEALPDVGRRPTSEPMRATGTYDSGDGFLPSFLPEQGTSSVLPLASPDKQSRVRTACPMAGNPTKTGVSGTSGPCVSPSGTNAPRWTRTSNLRFRRPMLYPIELAAPEIPHRAGRRPAGTVGGGHVRYVHDTPPPSGDKRTGQLRVGPPAWVREAQRPRTVSRKTAKQGRSTPKRACDGAIIATWPVCPLPGAALIRGPESRTVV